MKKLALLFAITFLLSGCTVAHFAYVRNLSEGDVRITVVFPSGKVAIPDSLYFKSSTGSHILNARTPELMKDSIVARRLTTNKISLLLPEGNMVMWDKITAQKFSYTDPESIIIEMLKTGTTTTVYFDPKSTNEKKFKSKGNISWFDIY